MFPEKNIEEATGSKSGKPSRPCVYCGLYLADIRRHLLTKHSNEPQIAELISGKETGVISRKQSLKIIAQLRRDGIDRKNKELMIHGKTLLCERRSKTKPSAKKVICSQCRGYFDKYAFYKHKARCAASKKEEHDVAIPLALATALDNNNSGKLNDCNLMAKMTKDDMFSIIEKDSIIQVIGKQIYDARKPNKEKQARDKARNYMRKLAKLSDLVGVKEAQNLFLLENLTALVDAITKICEPEEAGGDIKSGVKVNLGNMIKMCSRILISHYGVKGDTIRVASIRAFNETFSSPTHYRTVFAEAEYQLVSKRNKVNRKPIALPKKEDVDTLFNFLTCEIEHLTESGINNQRDLIKARKVLVTYLTLGNARRGGEVCHLSLEDYNEREDWINRANLTNEDSEILKHFSLTFVDGKRGLVPIFLPRDTVPLIDMIATPDVRRKCKVSVSNTFLFPNTGESKDPPVGYNEVCDMCRKAGVKVMTANDVRHDTSTQFWSRMGKEAIGPEEVASFMEHMGHSQKIDESIYACPPALKLLRQVPKHLKFKTVSVLMVL